MTLDAFAVLATTQGWTLDPTAHRENAGDIILVRGDQMIVAFPEEDDLTGEEYVGFKGYPHGLVSVWDEGDPEYRRIVFGEE
eukprot:gene31257-31865_t